MFTACIHVTPTDGEHGVDFGFFGFGDLGFDRFRAEALSMRTCSVQYLSSARRDNFQVFRLCLSRARHSG